MPQNTPPSNDLLRLVEAGTSGRQDRKGDCLDELALASLAEERVEAEARARYLAHLATCGHCRRQLAGLVELLADPEVAGEINRIGGRETRAIPLRRLLAGAGIVAAAAIAFVLIRSPATNDLPSRHRGPTITAGNSPAPASPVGDVATASALSWTAVEGADRYRVTLFDASGTVLFLAQLSDTVVALPDSVVLVPGRSYLWKVEARTGWDRWTASDLIEFRINPEASLGPLMASFAAISQTPAPDSLRLLAPRLSDSALVLAIRTRPLEVREALSGTLALSMGVGARDNELRTARRIAAAYATAWHDSFLVREVERFIGWPPPRRAAKIWADSVRRVGSAAFGQDGAAAAIVIWRRALLRATANADTAGMAAILGNIGAALARDDRPDSAEIFLESSRSLASLVGDLRVQANATAELAGVRETRNDVAGARQLYARAIVLRERIGDSRGLAADYNNLAGLARAASDFDEARRQLEAALALNRRGGRAEVAATNLVNLAALASLTGDFARGASLYREALTTWRNAEQWADAADALRGLGDLEQRRGDYPAAATDLQDALSIYDRTGPFADGLAVRQDLAAVHAAEGRLQVALDELRRTQRLADSARVGPDVRAGITLARADLARQLNSRPEAQQLYVGAEQLYRRAGNRTGVAEAQQGQGMLLLDQDKSAQAQGLLDAALRTEEATGDQRTASLTRLVLGEVAFQRGDTTAARRQLARAFTDLDRLGDPVGAAAALGERGMLEAAANYPVAAESLFRAGLAKVGDRIAPEVTWRLHAGLGAVRQSRGAVDAAAGELRASIADIERAGGSLTLAERRSGFLTDKWDVYVQLALLEEARGRGAAAFDVSERIRANEMLEMLAQGRVAAPRDTATELVAREQDLRRRIGELTRGLESGPAGAAPVRGPDVSRASDVTREALLRAQEAYTALLLEIRERAPVHSALVSRQVVTWREVAGRLGSDAALIEYLVSDTSSVAFVITRDTLVTIDLHVGREQLAPLVDFVRGTLQPRGSSHLDSLWRAPLRQLHRDLIAPIEASGLLRGKTRLTFVPHAELHYLPFAALLGRDSRGVERFLVERFQVMVTPSASVWLTLGGRRAARAATGMLALAPRPEALPASREEVATIGRLEGSNASVMVGRTATEAAFRREAPTRKVIHLATYGVLNKQNPLFSFVELAPDGSNDGRLEVYEVFGLRLAADLVVLSACQTGLGSGALTDVPAGDDWIGLVRAFLSAGAGHVMATLWPVQDRATATLMERFYQAYHENDDPGSALASAQRSLIGNAATASPYYWAGFEVVGGR